MEKNKELENKKEELMYIIFSNSSIKKKEIEDVYDIYNKCINNKNNYPYDTYSIANAAMFIKNNKYYCNIVIPIISKVNDEKDIFKIVDYNGTEIIPGKSIEKEEEYTSFIRFLINVSNSIINGTEKHFLLIENKEKSVLLDSKINELFKLGIDELFNNFIKCYDKILTQKNKILSFYDLLDDYFKEPSIEKYNSLMSKLSYLNGVNDLEVKKEIKTFIKVYASFVKKSNKSNELKLLKTREDNKVEKNVIIYSDLDEVLLNEEQKSILSEIFDFVCSLDKENFKVFAAEPLSFFNHIDESYKEAIINNFIVMMENKKDFSMKKTIEKRLMPNRR